jgi:protein tyrosine phosphatase (PTP) superfamily phosphohydrolase (DUF442 family)
MTACLPAALLAVALVVSPGTPAAAASSPTAAPGQGAGSSVPADRSTAGRRVAMRISGLPGLSNVGRLAPGIYRGAQPKAEGYRALKAMGIRTVVNLRSRHSERAAVEAAGLRSIEIPMSTTEVSAATVKRVVALMTDPAIQPVFVHCAHGEDRTGVVVAVYRMEVDGWSNAEAEAEMQAFGFNDVWRKLKAFVRAYPAPAAATSR